MAMANSVYVINKGINKSIEFKGLKAQYIWYLGGGLVALVILFAILYICGVYPMICVCLVVGAGGVLFVRVYAMSNRYGQYGLMKAQARRSIPKLIKVNSRKVFLLKKEACDGK